MGLKMDTTLHFANNVISVEGEGVEIDADDPSTVIVNNLAASDTDVSIIVEVPSDNTVLYIAGGVGAVLVGLVVWLVLVKRKKKTA
jgi:LPXTG-motif cell wall-anchored protein